MAFQLAYEEGTVLSTALLIAIREWQVRLDNPQYRVIHEECRAQISIAQGMLDRLLNPPTPDRNAGIRAMELRLGKLLDL